MTATGTRRDFLKLLIPMATSATEPAVYYDPELLEAVVGEAMRRQGRLPKSMLLEIERLYQTIEPENRDKAFQSLNREMFENQGHHAWLLERLRAFPEALSGIEESFVHRARTPFDAGAELRDRKDGGKALFICLEPTVFEQRIDGFVNHELQHIEDILNPNFGFYKPRPLADSPARESLVRDRLKAVWAASVDGRLQRRGLEPLRNEAARRTEFGAFYRSLPDEALQTAFDKLWSENSPKFGDLLDMARSVSATLAWAGIEDRESYSDDQIDPILCPICRMPSPEKELDLSPEMIVEAMGDDPEWLPAFGMCSRCAEHYRVRTGQW